MSTSLKFDQSYWENRYQENKTGWDTGEITTPLKTYFDQLENKNLKILIPGAGNAHEAEYLHVSGFSNVFVLDIAQNPLANILERTPTFPKSNLLHEDFFTHAEKYDLIIEQTFFCALHPSERLKYAEKMADLLNPGGKLVGLLFDKQFDGGPPFGGTLNEYKEYFSHLFDFKIFGSCYNSIKPREQSELFMILQNKM